MAKGAALEALKVSAAAADLFRPRRSGVVILLYHRVGATTGGQVDLSARLFERQMAALAGTGRAATLERALEVLSGQAEAKSDPVVVTFDDGTADFADVAVPLMIRHGIPATLFLATEYVELGRSFPDDGRPLSWAALRDVMATGLVNVGSHTHSHALLDRVAPTRAADELDRSIDLIEERLGVRPRDFAYPKAVAGSQAAEAAVRSRFRSAALAGCRTNAMGCDPHRLSRSPIQRADGMRWFNRKLTGGMSLEDTVRRGLNRRRYRDATT